MKASKLMMVLTVVVLSCQTESIAPRELSLQERLESYFMANGFEVTHDIDMALLAKSGIKERPMAGISVDVGFVTDEFVNGLQAIFRATPKYEKTDLTFMKTNGVARNPGRTQDCQTSWHYYLYSNGIEGISYCSNCPWDAPDGGWKCVWMYLTD